MSDSHKYLIVGENDQHRMEFVNRLNKQLRNSQVKADQNPIYRKVEQSSKIQPIGDYPIKCLDQITQDVNNISGIIVLVNKDDLQQLTSLICNKLSDNLKKIIDIYCSKINLQLDIQVQPKLILATAEEHDYISNNDIYSNVKQFLTQQVREYIGNFKQLIVNKLGEWKILSDVTQSNIKLIQLMRWQLENCNFDSTQSQLFGNKEYMIRRISKPASGIPQSQLYQALNRSESMIQSESIQQRKRLVPKKTCCCQLI